MGKDVRKDPWKVANIMATYNYDQFRFIEGNRPIDNHFMKIAKMIEAVGTLWCPVLVNERMEIVDGQHRFKAFKFLKKPVIYVVQNGIGENEVSAMNTVSKNWNQNDWINFYANAPSEQKQDYKYLQALKKMFPRYAPSVYDMAVNGHIGDSSSSRKIKKGEYILSLEQYENAVAVLSWLDNFKDMVDQISGKKEYMHKSLIFCYHHERVDNDYLLESFKKYYNKIASITSMEIALSEIQKNIYNYQLRHPREPINIVYDYEFYKRGKRYKALHKEK